MSDQQPDLGALLQQAQAMQEQMMAAQAEAAAQTIEGRAAGGSVVITASGEGQFQGVSIDPSVLDDKEMLEDLVLAALRDVEKQVAELNRQTFGGILGQ